MSAEFVHFYLKSGAGGLVKDALKAPHGSALVRSVKKNSQKRT